MSIGKLPQDYLSTLISEIDHPDFVGILLGGSYARGDATQWSDVDIACIVLPNKQHREASEACLAIEKVGTKSLYQVGNGLANDGPARAGVP